MASFGENNIKVAVAVEVTEASVGAGLSSFLKRHALKRLSVCDQASEQQSADS
jgi:hypothetical protein